MTEKEDTKDGLIETFFKNGQLRSRGNFNNGKREGLVENFYKNGQLRNRDTYKNGELVE